jgi:plastocyanin domain-containing protein
MNKSTTISIIIVAVIVGGIIFLNFKNSQRGDSLNPQKGISSVTSTNNVSVENGVQIITLEAKGGYSPRRSLGKAGIPTVIRFSTNGTFDCSLSVRLPSLGLSKILPQTGTTDISLGTSTPGLFRGSCGMGMYPLEIDFE